HSIPSEAPSNTVFSSLQRHSHHRRTQSRGFSRVWATILILSVIITVLSIIITTIHPARSSPPSSAILTSPSPTPTVANNPDSYPPANAQLAFSDPLQDN